MFRSPVMSTTFNDAEKENSYSSPSRMSLLPSSPLPLSPKSRNTPSQLPFPDKVAMFNTKPRSLKLFNVDEITRSAKKRNRENNYENNPMKKKVSLEGEAIEMYDVKQVKHAVEILVSSALDKVDKQIAKMNDSFDVLACEMKRLNSESDALQTSRGGDNESEDRIANLRKLLSKTVQRLHSQKTHLDDTKIQFMKQLRMVQDEVEQRLRDQTRVSKRLKKWVKEKYEDLVESLSAVTKKSSTGSIPDLKELSENYWDELHELQYERKMASRELTNLVDRQKEELRVLRRSKDEILATIRKERRELEEERQELKRDYKTIIGVIEEERSFFSKMRKAAQEEEKRVLLSSLETEPLSKSKKAKIFKKKKKPKKIPVAQRPFDVSSFLATEKRSSFSLMPPPKSIGRGPRSSLLTPPARKTQSRLTSFLSPDPVKTPRDKTWGAKEVSIESYYFDETLDAGKIDENSVRKWAKNDNLLRLVEKQKYLNPRDVFGKARKSNLNLSEVFGELLKNKQ